jgi:hypothetical protein
MKRRKEDVYDWASEEKLLGFNAIYTKQHTTLIQGTKHLKKNEE